MQRRSLVVVTNRLPFDEAVAPEGAFDWQHSTGVLVAPRHAGLRDSPVTWVGWSGHTGPLPDPPDTRGLRVRPVPLTEEDFRNHYEGYANATLWPLYHDAVEHPAHHRRWWEAYQRVNRRFAELTAEVAEPNAVVWVQDYHLQLVPGLLRERRPDLTIGFFLHIPFPPPELFMRLPRRAELLHGLLGADLIGFQRERSVRNFRLAVADACGLDSGVGALTVDGRRVRTGVFPVSVDVPAVQALADRPEVVERAAQIRRDLHEPGTLLLSVDRMDYTKGIEHRLKAYRELVADGVLTSPDTTFVQVTVPSRERVEHYERLRERVEREVGRINGAYGRVGAARIHYLSRPLDRVEVTALYRAADVMLVTPLRDGMNLVAKEFVAARTDGGGALVLSEFAGAAAELADAYLVNPHDTAGLKRTVVSAIRAGADERRRRMAGLRAQVAGHDLQAWAGAFLDALVPGPPAAVGAVRAAQVAGPVAAV
ncbi:trehalose-6-phosphate synthase [Pilimelia anulata]|uniref:Trehalose-6-phosphate synthase n=1 Tax=Pilimelia anulata TaxID=53371 RepID=A0A8J3B1G1_9ACTN|nr:trehalose-6-phosphate synthase [Pilimelia anulata]GGJ85187.1 trehalose-6-phosphate synthase [Pilimelia anulata]